MKARAVAESFAEEHRLEFLPRLTLAFLPPSPGGGVKCVNAIRGTVADSPPGVLMQRIGLNGITIPSAQYEISGLRDVIEGLWVHKSGRSIWTRVALPRGYRELVPSSESFSVRYRVATPSDRDEGVAQRLLSDDFLAWFTEDRGRRVDVTNFEIRQGVLFIRGPGDAFRSTDKLEAFAATVAHIASAVAALTNSPSA
jgi:hypothetical protein